MDVDFDADVEDFAGRLKLARSGGSYRRLRDELRDKPDRGTRLLAALMKHRSQKVRSWSANVARKDLGRDAIPLLVEMATDRRLANRDEAMQQLEAIDLELLRPFVPDMRRIFRTAKDLYSPGGAAMWRLVRLGDRESATLFRAFAAGRNPSWYDHRMPLVLADYLADPTTLVQRIIGHDHDWMPVITTAARQLDVPGVDAALRDAANGAPDPECRRICEEELRCLLRERERPQPSWDIEA